MSRRLHMLQWAIVILIGAGLIGQIFGPDRWEDIAQGITHAAMLASIWMSAYGNYPHRRWLIYLAAIVTFVVGGFWLWRLVD